MTEILEKLRNIQIASVLHHRFNRKGYRSLVDVHEDTRVGDVLKTLSIQNILAVPVFKLDKSKTKLYTGIVSVTDILNWTVFQQVFDDIGDYESEMENQKDQNLVKKYLEIIQGETLYFNTPIKQLIGSTGESKETWTLYASDPVSSLLKVLTTNKYHRILVIDDRLMNLLENSSRITMITQSDLICYLVDTAHQLNRTEMEAIESMQVANVSILAKSSSFGLDTKTTTSRVVKVTQNFSALSAFRHMFCHQVSCVAVVDSRGALVANLSESDLRGLINENLENLSLTVYSYLELGARRSKDQVNTLSTA